MRKWKISARHWTVTAKGREEFNGLKVEGDVVTITLSPNEMVLVK